MKIMRNIGIGLVLVVAVLILARNFIIRSGIEQGIRAATGLKLEIGKLDIGFLKPVVSIRNLTLYNPEGTPDPVMAEVDEIYVQYILSDVIKGVISLKEVRFNMTEFTVVRQTGKALNLDALKALQPPKGEGPPPKFSIDDLSVAVGKVVFKDYTTTPVTVKDYNLNINEHYTHIKSADDLVRLIVVSALQRTTIANLTQFNLKDLKQTLSSSLINSLQSQSNPIKNLLNNLNLK